MTIRVPASLSKPTHDWLRATHIAFVQGPSTPLLDQTAQAILRRLGRDGHHIQTRPDESTEAILTTSQYAQPLNWRDALMFTGRRRFNLPSNPIVFTLMQVHPQVLNQTMRQLTLALEKDPPDPVDYDFPGLAPTAYRVLSEQARRGGPIMAVARLMQAWAKCFRILLIVGADAPERAYHFDLVGAHPISEATDLDLFYEDIALRIATTVSSREVADHAVVDPPISRAEWQGLSTPGAMRRAGQELGARDFFTDPVQIAELVRVPVVPGAIASQYSEGCFATWEPRLDALLTTITGSVRAFNKGHITEDEIAVVTGLRADGMGVLVRHVADKRNDPPSSEAVELFSADLALPRVPLAGASAAAVPVIRSKLHGHRGITAYDPQRVEYVPLDASYYHYLVSCATESQAQGVNQAFARAQALQNPADSRQVVFTILPGHGVIFAEKWVAGKEPFQLIWEYMDAGYLQLTSWVAQGPLWYAPRADGMMELRTE